MTTVPASLVRVLREERTRIIPFVGAGMVIGAGLPGTWATARALRSEAADRGIDIPHSADFVEVCAVFERECGIGDLRAEVARIVSASPPTSTPELEAIARCPSRIILTANYDTSIETAVEATGRTAVPFWLDRAAAWAPPADGEVHVVHVHGLAADPDTLVLPGPSTQALEEDDRFKTVLRALVAPYPILYFGFALGGTETHLRAELDWLARSFTDAGVHHLLLPATESANRGDEFAELVRKPQVQAHLYDDSTTGHVAVRHASLLLAPQAPVRPVVVERRALQGTEYYRPGALVAAEPDDDPVRVRSRRVAAELGLNNERFVTTRDMLGAGRVLLEGPPGVGKTQTLLACGRDAPGYHALRLQCSSIAGHLGAEDLAGEPPGLRALLGALRHAEAFNGQTPRPTAENLDSASYALLLDAFDELPAERRAGVLGAIGAGVERFPHHAWILATRSTVDASLLYEDDFDRFAMVESESWGVEYMRFRGVSQEALDELRDLAPTASTLIGIPIYAAAIAEPLVRGEHVPDTPLELLVAAEHEAIPAEAEFVGASNDQVFEYLQRVAVALELQGVTEAPAEELAEIAGSGALDAEQLREELVQHALLQDRPGLLSFPSRVMQEALCADALLKTDDPAATVRHVAVAELAGVPVLRTDMDHCLDLLWESAPAALRGELREIDELRWARSQRPDDSSQRSVALDVLWDWFVRRRIWLSDDHDRQHSRGSEAAVRRLLRAEPNEAESRRAALVAATHAELATTRGNAITWLDHLPAEDAGSIMAWLRDRLADTNPVVRRRAATYAADHAVAAAALPLREQLQVETDATAAQTLGSALLALTSEADLPDVAAGLYARSFLWRRLGSQVIERLDVDTSLTLLIGQHAGRDEFRELLVNLLDKQSEDQWSEQQVAALCEALVAHVVDVDEVTVGKRVSALAQRHPEAALHGAEAGARTSGTDLLLSELWFLRELPRTALEAGLGGPLVGQIERVVQLQESPPPAPAGYTVSLTAGSGTAPPEDPDVLPLGEALDRELYRADQPPMVRDRWPADSLSEGQRTKLAQLVEVWWPEGAISDGIRLANGGWQLDASVLSVVLAAGSIKLPLSQERWLDVYASGAPPYARGVAEWLAGEYRAAYAGGAADVIAGLQDGYALVRAVDSLGGLEQVTAEAVGERLAIVTDGNYLGLLAGRLVDFGRLDLVRGALESQTSTDLRRVLRGELARAGDVDAQLQLLEELVSQAQANQVVDPDALAWHATVRDERLIPALADLLAELDDAPDNTPDSLSQRVRSALRATGSEQALGAFDRLIDDPDRPFRAFQWYPRAELAGELAREQVLARLPDRPAAIVDWVRQRGFGS